MRNMLRQAHKSCHYVAKIRALRTLAVVLYLALLSVVALPAIPALADQSDPDSTPTVEIDVYRNLLETGDRLFLIYSNVPYASLPHHTFSEAFIWRLIDTDGVTELGSTTGNVYNDDGYNPNVAGLYFSAADNVTWGSAYTLRLAKNPIAFTVDLTPPQWDFTVGASDYYSSSSASENQLALENRIILICSDLNNEWSLAAGYELTEQGESGTYLSVYGQAFIRDAIYGAQGLMPGIFPYSPLDIEGSDRAWDTEFSDNISSGVENAGTWIETAKEGGAALVGLDYDLASVILVLILIGAVAVGGMFIAGNVWAGILDGGIAAVFLARMGLYEVAFLALIVALLWEYFSARVWGLIR